MPAGEGAGSSMGSEAILMSKYRLPDSVIVAYGTQQIERMRQISVQQDPRCHAEAASPRIGSSVRPPATRSSAPSSGHTAPVVARRGRALLAAALLLREPLVEGGRAALAAFRAQRLTARTRIGGMPIRRHLLGCLLRHLQHCLEAGLGP
jgi:hypothetical protein